MAQVVVQSARITDIVRQIRGTALPFLGAYDEASDARDASQAAANRLTSSREGIMSALADLSMKGQWSAGEVKAASKIAADASRNETESALATFIAETRKAMSPKVRMHVDALISVRDKAWEAEKLAYNEDKTTPTPLRKAFSRGYHCLMQMMGEAEEGRIIDNVPALLGLAADKMTAERLDISKVMARLANIQAQLQAFHNDFPVDDLQLCVETMGEITEKALRAALVSTTVVAEKPFTPAVPAATVVAVNTAVQSPEDNQIDELMLAA